MMRGFALGRILLGRSTHQDDKEGQQVHIWRITKIYPWVDLCKLGMTTRLGKTDFVTLSDSKVSAQEPVNNYLVMETIL